jgi:hypothetical protein
MPQEALGRLKPQEIELIHLIRTKYKFGNLEIIIRDGVPTDLLKTVERTRLGTFSTDEFDKRPLDDVEFKK